MGFHTKGQRFGTGRALNSSNGMPSGLGLRLSGAAPAPPPFDPADISLLSWFRDYTGSVPWSSTASNGSTAGSQTFNLFFSSPGLATVNGHNVAVFDGTTSSLVRSTAPISDMITATEFSIIFLASIVSAPTSASDTDPLNDAIFTGTAALGGGGVGSIFMSLKSTPTIIGVGKDPVARSASSSISLGTWQAIQMRAHAGVLGTRVNGGSWTTTSFAGLSDISGGTRIGVNANASQYVSMSLAEFLFCKTAFSDATFDDWRAYFNTRYAISV